jgi:hypothetical protein
LAILTVAYFAVQHLFAGVPVSPEDLAKQVEAALKSNDNVAMGNLYCWDGVDPNTKQELEFERAFLLQQTNKSVVAVPQLGGFKQEFAAKGLVYKFNLPIVGYIDAKSEQSSTKIPYGQKEGHFFLAGVIRGDPAAKAAIQKMISLQIAAPDSSFEGYYVYLSAGKEIQEHITDHDNFTKAFWGEGLQSCQVEKTSTNGWIQLIISEDGKVIFDSQKHESSKAIVYKKAE